MLRKHWIAALPAAALVGAFGFATQTGSAAAAALPAAAAAAPADLAPGLDVAVKSSKNRVRVYRGPRGNAYGYYRGPVTWGPAYGNYAPGVSYYIPRGAPRPGTRAWQRGGVIHAAPGAPWDARHVFPDPFTDPWWD